MNTPPNADDLAAIALELAVRVRDESATANKRWLAERLPDSADWFRLAFVLAAAVPIDRGWLQLTAWTVDPPVQPAKARRPRRQDSKPCGTPAAAERHRYHGEELCDPCREADRDYDRERKRIQRAA